VRELKMDKLKEQWQEAPLWQKALLITIVSLIFSYLIFMNFIDPKMTEIADLEKEKQQMEQELSFLKKTSNLAELSKINKKIQEMEEKLKNDKLKLEEFYRMVPTSPKIEEVLDSIAKKSSMNGLIISSFSIDKEEEIYLSYDEANKSLKIQPKEEPKEQDKNKTQDKKQNAEKENKESKSQSEPKDAILVKRIPINLSFVSRDFKSIEAFIDSLSKENRLISVKNISIGKGEEKDKQKVSNKINFDIQIAVYYIPEEVKNNETKK
jgi:Tfp pilus assembly protein PilO